MSDLDTTIDPPIGIIPIHFDVPRHYLPLPTFIETAVRTRAVIDAFNRELYDGQLKYDLLVFPPEEGTFLSRLGVALLAGWGVIWTFTESEIGKRFIKGLTSHEPGYWAEIVGAYAKDKLLDSVKATGAASSKAPASPRVRCQYETTIITESTKSFLQGDREDLAQIGITTRKYRDAYDARNGFYQACTSDQQVKGIGFDEADDFPIKRKDFLRLQVSLPPPEEPKEDVAWQVEILTLKVTSPNWDKRDRKRQWKARDENNRECLFRMEDEQFWNLVQSHKIDPRFIDKMRVQMAFVGRQRRHARVLRVLEYNGQVLGEPLDHNALFAILGSFNSPPGDDYLDLFDR